jgi:hypothetical protein
MVGTALAIGAGALLGGVAGAIPSKSSSNSSSGVIVGASSDNENAATDAVGKSFGQLQSMVNAGPGQSDVTAAQDNNKSLANMLGQYAATGGQPTAADIQTAQTTSGQLFQGQQTALNQSFTDQSIDANRQAAMQGRDMNDPVLAAKLATEQVRQQQQLSANQGSFAQQYAMQQPQQRLGYAQAQNGMLNGLATQAMANRQAIASMGSSIQGNERNWRLRTAGHYGNTTSTSGGGLGGALTGLIGGAGIGQSFAAGMNGSSPFTSGAPSNPTAGVTMAGTGTSAGIFSGMNYNSSPMSNFGNGGNFGNWRN